jgi:hypothetical protein
MPPDDDEDDWNDNELQQKISEAFAASKKGAGEPADWRSLIFGDNTSSPD